MFTGLLFDLWRDLEADGDGGEEVKYFWMLMCWLSLHRWIAASDGWDRCCPHCGRTQYRRVRNGEWHDTGSNSGMLA